MSRLKPEEIGGRLQLLVQQRGRAEKRLAEEFDRLERAIVRVEWDRVGFGSRHSFAEEITAIVIKLDRTPGEERLFLMVPGRKEIDEVPVAKIIKLEIIVENDESPLLFSRRAEEVFAELVHLHRSRIQEEIDRQLSRVD